MSKKPVKPATVEQPIPKSDSHPTIHLKVLADLFTKETTYLQGQVVEVDESEALRLQRDHAGYFEAVTS